MYLFGLLVYEMIVGKAAFPSDKNTVEEDIINSRYKIPEGAPMSE
jgi:hypothetical protein